VAADARSHEPDPVAGTLRKGGATCLSWYGVRRFSDRRRAGEIPEGIAEPVTAGEEAGRRASSRSPTAPTPTAVVRTARTDPSPVHAR